MNLLIPSLALAAVALLLLVVIGKILGGHSGVKSPNESEPAPRASDALEPPRVVGAPVGAPTLSPIKSPDRGLDPAFAEELQGLIAKGNLIQAIKRYREAQGVSLKEAKEAVDRLRAGAGQGAPPAPIAPPRSSSADARRDPEVLSHLAKGRKIQAIKRYRELTGAGLKESKEAVEALQSGAPQQPPGVPSRSADPTRDPELLAALAKGKKILAIKRYRELTGAGLKESKEAVEAMR